LHGAVEFHAALDGPMKSPELRAVCMGPSSAAWNSRESCALSTVPAAPVSHSG
jgi:hypothetical protein